MIGISSRGDNSQQVRTLGKSVECIPSSIYDLRRSAIPIVAFFLHYLTAGGIKRVLDYSPDYMAYATSGHFLYLDDRH
jgi:hypothetical protein